MTLPSANMGFLLCCDAGGQVPQDWAAAAQPHVVAEHEDEADHCGHSHLDRVSVPVRRAGFAGKQLLPVWCSALSACVRLSDQIIAALDDSTRACLRTPPCLHLLVCHCMRWTCCMPARRLAHRLLTLCVAANSTVPVWRGHTIFPVCLLHCLQGDYLLRGVLLWRKLLQVKRAQQRMPAVWLLQQEDLLPRHDCMIRLPLAFGRGHYRYRQPLVPVPSFIWVTKAFSMRFWLPPTSAALRHLCCRVYSTLCSPLPSSSTAFKITCHLCLLPVILPHDLSAGLIPRLLLKM